MKTFLILSTDVEVLSMFCRGWCDHTDWLGLCQADLAPASTSASLHLSNIMREVAASTPPPSLLDGYSNVWLHKTQTQEAYHFISVCRLLPPPVREAPAYAETLSEGPDSALQHCSTPQPGPEFSADLPTARLWFWPGPHLQDWQTSSWSAAPVRETPGRQTRPGQWPAPALGRPRSACLQQKCWHWTGESHLTKHLSCWGEVQ